MKSNSIILLTLTLIIGAASFQTLQCQSYYKDLFINGGIKLTSLSWLPSAILLDLSNEYLTTHRPTSTFPPTHLDTIRQNNLIIGSDMDVNGVLLYPDGEPRFRLIYVNGGTAANHGESLGHIGRDRIKTFIRNGGSYLGTCAGAFISSKGTIREDTVYLRSNYLGIWPGITKGTRLTRSYTGLIVEPGSPLLKYSDFGGDNYIDSVRHNGGCFAVQDENFPLDTEILLRYNYPKKGDIDIHNKINAWSYKESDETGRIVVTGSHPEAIGSGERLELMAALMQYALDGSGLAKIKGELENGKTRQMYKTTYDKDPDYTMIGDKQYHHFVVNIPENAIDVSVELNGAYGYDLFLYLKKDNLAFRNVADYINIDQGSEKSFRFNKLKPGRWYLAVECFTTVETIKREWGYEYTGKIEVLNGVPYNITISWQ